MIEETAIVTGVHNGQVLIKSLQTAGCGSCQQQTTCGTSTLGKLLPKREFAVDCDMPLKIGDQVKVGIDDSQLLISSILLYLLPLLVMLFSVALANFLLPVAVADDWLPLVALCSLLLAFWGLRRLQGVLLLHLCFKPQIMDKC